MDFLFIYLTLFFISTVQSIAGVGILVLGTPLLLLINYSIIEIMLTLLPLSLLSSSLNLIFIKFIFKLNNFFDFRILKYFLMICLPGVLCGILLLKYFDEVFNFKIIVAIVILISVLLRLRFSSVFSESFKFKKIPIFFIGLIHGLTNSGGTLLTLLLLNKDHKNANLSRFQIHFFYFLLALFQIFFLKIININMSIHLELNLIIVLCIIITSSIIGNLISYKFQKIINFLIFSLAFIAAFILFIRNLI